MVPYIITLYYVITMPRGGKHSGNKGRSASQLPEADSSSSIGTFVKPVCGKTATVNINGKEVVCRMPGSSKARGHRVTYRTGDHVIVDDSGTITGRVDPRVWDSVAPIDDPTDPDSSYVFSDAVAAAHTSAPSVGIAAPATPAVDKTQQKLKYRQAERERALRDRSGTGRMFTDPCQLASGAASSSSDDSDAGSDDDLPSRPLNVKGVVAQASKGKKNMKGKKGSSSSDEPKKANRVQPQAGSGVAAPSAPLVTPADLDAFDDSDISDI